MPATKSAKRKAPIGARCDLERRSFPIAISDITPDGCSCEAACEWDDDCEFLHLRIADSVEINGRVLWHQGQRAAIGFFGQIHPAVIDEWKRLAA
jgi:phenylalanyl-tRNA synthetase beta subunit